MTGSFTPNDEAFVNPQTERRGPKFGCLKECAYVDECENESDCIRLYPLIKPEPA